MKKFEPQGVATKHNAGAVEELIYTTFIKA